MTVLSYTICKWRYASGVDSTFSLNSKGRLLFAGVMFVEYFKWRRGNFEDVLVCVSYFSPVTWGVVGTIISGSGQLVSINFFVGSGRTLTR